MYICRHIKFSQKRGLFIRFLIEKNWAIMTINVLNYFKLFGRRPFTYIEPRQCWTCITFTNVIHLNIFKCSNVLKVYYVPNVKTFTYVYPHWQILELLKRNLVWYIQFKTCVFVKTVCHVVVLIILVYFTWINKQYRLLIIYLIIKKKWLSVLLRIYVYKN